MVSMIILFLCSHAWPQDIKIKKSNDNCAFQLTLIDSVINQLKNSTPSFATNTYINNNAINANERIDFLNSDFATTGFDKGVK